MTDEKDMPTYGLLAINHAYNEGRITFQEWLKLSRAWALKMIEQYEGADCRPCSCSTIERVDESTGAA